MPATQLDSLVTLLDSLRYVAASRHTLVEVAVAHHETLSVRLVPSPSHGWGGWSVLGQLGAAVVTVFIGVAVFAITQALAKLAIEPSLEVRRVIGRVGHALVFYANVHSNVGDRPTDLMDKVQHTYRDLSSELRSAAANVPPWARRPMAALGVIPGWEDIRWSAQHLIGLSNSIHRSPLPDQSIRNTEMADKIRSRLGVDMLG